MAWEYSDNEYIKLYRKFINWEWYSDPITKAVFLHCLLKANWKPTRWKGIDLQRGEFIERNENIAKDLKLSVQQIRTAFQHLANTDSISFRKVGKQRIINVSKYMDYQAVNSKSTAKSTVNQHRINSESTADIRSKEHIRSKEEIKEPTAPILDDDEGMSADEFYVMMQREDGVPEDEIKHL